MFLQEKEIVLNVTQHPEADTYNFIKMENIKEEPADDVTDVCAITKQEDPLEITSSDISAVVKEKDTFFTVIKEEINLDQCYQEESRQEPYTTVCHLQEKEIVPNVKQHSEADTYNFIKVESIKEQPADNKTNICTNIKQEDPLEFTPSDINSVVKDEEEDTFCTLIKEELDQDECYREQLSHQPYTTVCHLQEKEAVLNVTQHSEANTYNFIKMENIKEEPTNNETDVSASIKHGPLEITSSDISAVVKEEEDTFGTIIKEEIHLDQYYHEQFSHEKSLSDVQVFVTNGVHEVGLNSPVLDSSETATLLLLLVQQSEDENIHKKIICNVCDKSFIHSDDLSKHELTHSSSKTFQCDICNKYFAKPKNLSQHKSIHNQNKKHQCDICGKTLTRSYYLYKHKLTYHTNKSFTCDVCNESFSQLCYLTKHKFTHKMFQCDVCNKTFSQSNNLINHKLIHSDNRKCDMCNKVFSRPYNLAQHKLRIHEDKIHKCIKKIHKCDVCNKSFKELRSFSLHMGSHSKKCNLCNKTLTRSRNMKRHLINVHSNIKSFQCDMCTKSFKQLRSLLHHKKRHSEYL